MPRARIGHTPGIEGNWILSIEGREVDRFDSRADVAEFIHGLGIEVSTAFVLASEAGPGNPVEFDLPNPSSQT